MAGKPVPIEFPMGGVAESQPYSSDPSLVSVRLDHVLNVRPYDSLDRRKRGGQRTGISKYIAVAANGSAVQNMAQAVEAVALTVEAGFGSKWADPSTLPTDAGYFVDTHPDGDCIVSFTGASSPFHLVAYNWSETGGWGSQIASTAVSTTSTLTPISVKFSPSGGHIIVIWDTSAPARKIEVRPFSKTTGVGAAVTLPSATGVAYADTWRWACWKPDGNLVLGYGDKNTPYGVAARLYDFTGGTVGSLLSTATYSTGPNNNRDIRCEFLPDGSALVMVNYYSGSATNGYHVWPYASGFGTAIYTSSSASDWTAGFSVTSDSQYVSEITFGGTSLKLRTVSSIAGVSSSAAATATLTSTPPSQYTQPNLSPSGAYLTCGVTNTPYINLFPFSGTFGTRLANPGTLPSHSGYGTAWSPAGTTIFLANSDTARLTAYAFNPEEFNPSARKSRLVVVQGGSVYRSDYPPTTLTLCNSGTSAVKSSGPIRSAQAFQKLFYCDGFSANYKYLKYSTNTVTSWASSVTAGALPSGTTDTTLGCQIITLYRGRIVMAGLQEEPQNWFMSKSGDPFDWNYSPTTTSATQAVAGNNSNAGELGDVLTCVAPYQDDVMMMGGVNSLWVMRGDPAAGGQIDNISRQIGIVGPEAFAWAPGGVFYFVARNGLYRMTYDSSPECVSKGKLDKTFSNIDLTTYRVQCLYDTTWQGVHIFLIPYAQPSAAPTHFWFDERTGGFWPDAYPIVGGPTCVLNFMADNPDDAAVVLGGWDGYVRFFDPAAKSDDGIAIDSYVRFPLVHPSLPMGQFQASDMQFTMGEGSDATDFTMYRGNTPEEAAESVTSVFTRSLIGGRNQPSRMRIRANSLQAKIANIANNQTWAYESGSMVIGGVGRLRTPSGV